MPPSCHDLPFLRLFIRTWGRSEFLGHPCGTESHGSPGSLLPTTPPACLFSLLRLALRGEFLTLSSSLLAGLLSRSCSLSAAALPSCVALGLALLRPPD